MPINPLHFPHSLLAATVAAVLVPPPRTGGGRNHPRQRCLKWGAG